MKIFSQLVNSCSTCPSRDLFNSKCTITGIHTPHFTLDVYIFCPLESSAEYPALKENNLLIKKCLRCPMYDPSPSICKSSRHGIFDPHIIHPNCHLRDATDSEILLISLTNEGNK